MAATARKFEVGPHMPERTVIEEKVDRLREDVTGLKADVRAIGTSLSEHCLETEKSIGKLRAEMKDSDATLRTELKDSDARLRTELRDSIAALHSKLNAHLAWTVGTVIAASGALFTAARFFAKP